MLEGLSHSFEIALESIKNNVLVTNIEELSHLLSKGLDSSLHKGLLSINI